eukprot:12933716-Ditylum_brightwellii.AAC.1
MRSNLPAAVIQILVSVPQNLLKETQPASSKETHTLLSLSPTSSAVYISIKENIHTPRMSSISMTSSK